MTDSRPALVATTATVRRGRQVRSDAELLVATREDPEAFGEFFDRHYDGVLAYFSARVRSPHTAADLCAETLAAVLVGSNGFDPHLGSPRQWMFGIARHKLSRYWRDERVSRSARDRLGVPDVEMDAETVAALARVEAGVDRHRLFAALDRLPSDQGSAVRLRIIDDLDYGEVAQRLGCRIGAARVRVHRGLKRLKREFDGE